MEIEKNLLTHIEKAKDGNQKAFKFLLDTYWNDVYGFIFKRTKHENDAEDITIQTFAKAFDRIDTFDPNYTFKTWLMTISKNVHVDLLRRQKTAISIQASDDEEQKVYAIADDAPTPEDKIITEQNLAQLLRDIKELKPHYQEIINLRYFQELSYKEIAAKLDESMNNVKVKLLRAKKLLAEIIQDRK